jgi:hypothetical protein
MPLLVGPGSVLEPRLNTPRLETPPSFATSTSRRRDPLFVEQVGQPPSGVPVRRDSPSRADQLRPTDGRL